MEDVGECTQSVLKGAGKEDTGRDGEREGERTEKGREGAREGGRERRRDIGGGERESTLSAMVMLLSNIRAALACSPGQKKKNPGKSVP